MNHARRWLGGEELGPVGAAEEGEFHQADEQQSRDIKDHGDGLLGIAIEEGGREGQEGDQGQVDHVEAGVDRVDRAKVPYEVEVRQPIEGEHRDGDEEGEQVPVDGEELLVELVRLAARDADRHDEERHRDRVDAVRDGDHAVELDRAPLEDRLPHRGPR